MLKRSSLSLAVVAMAMSFPACGGQASEGKAFEGVRVPVRVMTRNLYLGSDISSVILAPNAEALPALAAGFFANVVRSDFPARAKLLADEIVATNPDVIGLQEVELFRRQSPSDFATTPGVNATAVVIDFLALLQAELVARGATYNVAAENILSDVELPASATPQEQAEGGLIDLRMTDRDVILVKPALSVAAPSNVVFKSFFSANIGGDGRYPIRINRGYQTVALSVPHPSGPASFTFANAHLEVGGQLSAFQEPQANELVTNLNPVSPPLVLVGDFNSSADGMGTRSYARLRTLFDDAHFKVTGAAAGNTCCIDIFGAAAAPAGTRIDLVLTRGNVTALDAVVVGAQAKTPAGGVSASDHYGVVMTLGLVPDSAR